MQKQKYISILVASAGILMPVFSANAQMLMPSLHAQMERQSKVDAQYAQDKIRMHNEQRSAELRQEAAERIQKLEKKSEPTLDPIARDAALSRRVVKITEPTPQSSIKNNPRENITLNAAPTSRSTGNIDMNQVEQEWLSWVNNLRQENNLHTLTSDARLSYTAQEWSEFSKNR